MTTTIKDLPVEILLKIFRELNIFDVASCARAFKKWRNILALEIIYPRLQRFARLDSNFQDTLHGNGFYQNVDDAIDFFDNIQDLMPVQGKSSIRSNLFFHFSTESQ